MAEKKTFWDRFAFAYDFAESFNKKVYRSMLARIRELTPPGAAVLECAAGTGAITMAIAPRAAQVVCTDLSLPMLERAKQKVLREGFRNISFAQRDLMHLSDPDERYDMVVAANVIHLLDEPYAALHELWRVTKRGGLLVVPTFLTGEKKPMFGILLRVYEFLGFQSKSKYSLESYQELMEQSDLPKPGIERIEGKMPVGIAVFKKKK